MERAPIKTDHHIVKLVSKGSVDEEIEVCILDRAARSTISHSGIKPGLKEQFKRVVGGDKTAMKELS